MYEKLIHHVGHQVEVVTYGLPEGPPANVAVECIDCGEVLVDEDNPEV